ncbi:type II/IV secretion system protein, partial [Phormidium sp. FACHB-592]|nr:type II/IV secretion system protein [Phormidium sp. FACHB-592]
MQTLTPPTSVFKQLKKREITCEEALKLLVNHQGVIKFDLLDAEVSDRFFRQISDRSSLHPVVPLLLWRNCYYLGSPLPMSAEAVQRISDRLATEIKIIPIHEKSYRDWFRLQNLDTNRICGTNFANPLTGKFEQEDITQTTELYLSQTDNQIERIRAIIAGALRNRASDIHLEPTEVGLRVRYRIDGILRHVTTLPPDISR